MWSNSIEQGRLSLPAVRPVRRLSSIFPLHGAVHRQSSASKEALPCFVLIFFFCVRHLLLFFFYKISYTLCPCVNASLRGFQMVSSRRIKFDFHFIQEISACALPLDIPDHMARPSPFVINGITVLPLKSCAFTNDRTAGAMVYHQVGVPTAITS